MTPADNPRLEVSAALLFRAGRLLIAQRRQGDHLGGLWEFPGGKIEPGETPESCLRRELEEELGVQVAVGPLVAEVSHDYPGRRVHLRFHRCRLLEGEPAPLLCQAIAWIAPCDLERFEFPAADAALIARLASPEARAWWEEPEQPDGPAQPERPT